MYDVKIATEDEFRRSRDEWNRLVGAMTMPTVFCSWEWIYSWWEEFKGSGREPFILFIRRREELKGVMPLFSYRSLFGKKWMAGKILSYCGSGDLFPDQLDVICDPADAQECLGAVFGFLTHECDGWDLFELPLMTADCSLARWLQADSVGRRGLRAELAKTGVAPFIRLDGLVFDDFLAGLDGKQRYNLRARRKKLQQSGARYEACHDETCCLSELLALHASRADRKKMESTFAGERIHRFHEAFIRRCQGSDRVWFRSLRIEGRPIAVFYGFSVAGRLLFYQTGIDPAWERFGPGMTLIYEVLQEAFSRGFKEFDFLRGNEPYKYAWTRTERGLHSGVVFNDTALASLSRSVLRSKRLLSKRAGYVK